MNWTEAVVQIVVGIGVFLLGGVWKMAQRTSSKLHQRVDALDLSVRELRDVVIALRTATDFLERRRQEDSQVRHLSEEQLTQRARLRKPTASHRIPTPEDEDE